MLDWARALSPYRDRQAELTGVGGAGRVGGAGWLLPAEVCMKVGAIQEVAAHCHVPEWLAQARYRESHQWRSRTMS